MENLGNMMDAGLKDCALTPAKLVELFIKSGVAREMSIGNPRYSAGCSGTELMQMVLVQAGFPERELPPRENLAKGAEYWAGSSLAYYQWSRNIPFLIILEKIPLEHILASYHPLHEAGLEKFASVMDDWMAK